MIKGNSVVQSKNYSDGKVSRTKVGRHFKWRSTFNSAYLIPFWCDEVYPGQFKSVDLGELVRSITPLGPTMDNSFLDLFFFFVPNRLIWDHWEEFIAGYNKEAWTQDVVYQVPQIKFKTVANHAYDPNDYSKGIDGMFHYDNGVLVSPTLYSTNVFVHSWLDYLPGATDTLNLAKDCFLDASLDYLSDDDVNSLYSISALYPRAYVKIWNDWFRDENLQDELELYTGDNDEFADEFAFSLLDPLAIPKAAQYHNRFTSALPGPQKGPDVLIPMNDLRVGIAGDNSVIGSVNSYPEFSSAISGFNQLYGIGDKDVPVIANNVSNTIRMLRLATQTELLLSRDARGGTRYVESLLSHFGVHNGDARLQRSEYLGSKQIPLQVMQVTNTAGTSNDPLGNVGGQSVTKDNGHYFSKAFTEHGIVFCVGCVRTNISYSSGIRKMYQRKDRFDFIWPEFKHIGDVPLYKKELYVSARVIEPDAVFGYTPYGSELREGYNFNNGLFRPDADGSLCYLTYQWFSYLTEDGDVRIPFLSDNFIAQPDTIRNTLVDQEGPEFYALFDLYSEDVIPLDPTSDPGLMDHF